jgi:hypothetical protein
MGLSRSLLHLS